MDDLPKPSHLLRIGLPSGGFLLFKNILHMFSQVDGSFPGFAPVTVEFMFRHLPCLLGFVDPQQQGHISFIPGIIVPINHSLRII
jgi:hypothetical protein